MSAPLCHPTVAAVKAIHAEVLAAHGGAAGLRDEALLESAVAAPQATMMGDPLFSDPLMLRLVGWIENKPPPGCAAFSRKQSEESSEVRVPFARRC